VRKLSYHRCFNGPPRSAQEPDLAVATFETDEFLLLVPLPSLHLLAGRTERVTDCALRVSVPVVAKNSSGAGSRVDHLKTTGKAVLILR
jgi:hypothetical protein